MKHYILFDDVKHIAVIPFDENVKDHIVKAISEDRCVCEQDKIVNVTIGSEDKDFNIKVTIDSIEDGEPFIGIELTLTPITVYGLPKTFEPHDLSNRERTTIDFLSSSLNDLRTAIEPVLPEKEIRWVNDLIDHVDVSLGGKPDGDNQHLIVSQHEAMTYEDMLYSLILRIHRIMEYVVDKEGNLKEN